MKHLPIISNIAYPIAGYFGDWITFTAGIILMAGSAWYHYEDEILHDISPLSVLADFFGIYAFTFAILAFYTNPFVLCALIGILAITDGMRNIHLVGLAVLLTILVTQSYIALLAFIPALIIRDLFEDSKWQDYSHTVWHLLSALGYYLILVGNHF